MVLFLLLLGVGAFLAAALLTWFVRRLAIRREVYDIPTHRSMHRTPVPRGGGLGIVIVVLAIVAALWAFGILSAGVGVALLAGGLLVAGVGFIDDLRGLGNTARLVVWFIAAFIGVVSVGGLPTLDLGFTTIRLGVFGSGLAMVGVVWMINLYNFMDGIDGLAASEGVVVAGAAGILLILGGATGIAAVAVVLAGCCAGFLVWNWPPARIFMGDVSSGFLGFVFAVLAIWTSNNGILELQVWAVLLGVFLIDATLTMARRMAAGEKWYTAHRSHAYQRAVTAGHSHLSVTLTVIAIDLALVAAAATMVFVPSARGYVLATTLGGLAVAWIAIVRRWPAAQRPNPIAR